MNKDLSVIIVSYNTSSLISLCIEKLISSFTNSKLSFEIIVVDNGSIDDSVKKLKRIREKLANLIVIENKKNLGYAKANNQAIKQAKGKYILFLNSDILIDKINWQTLLNFFETKKEVGALTIRINLKNGAIDPASHRGFPTLWRSFCYFSSLERVLSFNSFFKKIFGGYHLLHLDLNKIHEVEVISGAFFLTRKDLIKKIGGFDEDFFMYGEDIDLCLRIKQLNYKIIYYPDFEVLHLKYQSGLKSKNKKVNLKTRYYFYQAMKIFYQKHYQKQYPFFVNFLVYLLLNWKIKSYEKNWD
jgi:GT2 family glycosyltransferase